MSKSMEISSTDQSDSTCELAESKTQLICKWDAELKFHSINR